MKEYLDKNVLVSTSEWFVAPDGNQYKAVWGKLESINKVDESSLGFAPNRPNANWVFKIGNMFIYGCQIKYLILSEKRPQIDFTRSWEVHNGELKIHNGPSFIFVSEP